MKQAKPVHLIIDATCLANRHYSGVENFTFFLIREFDQLARENLLTYDLVVRGNKQLLINRLKYSLLPTTTLLAIAFCGAEIN